MLLNHKIPIAFFVRKIRYEALFVFLFVNCLFVIRHYFRLEVLTIPTAIPALVGTSISLLLAFRTNQAYERWWEARTVWGAIVNDSRTLIRQLLTFIGDESIDLSSARTASQRQIAWCYILGETLRGESTTRTIQTYVEEVEREVIRQAAHQPLMLLELHAQQLRQLYEQRLLTDIQLTQLDATLTRLTDAMGRCERIKRTIFPRTYTFYLQAFIILFTALLPFGFVEDLFFVEVPIVTLIASAFFLIEKSALQLQDPFENRATDTPVTTIAQGIENSLRQLVGEPLPTLSPISSAAYYQL